MSRETTDDYENSHKQEVRKVIEVSNLSKKYGNHVAVDDLSFLVEKGQIYGFLGPNGAGKSTTMNMICGYLAPSAGTVLINGHDIMKEPEEAKKCIGYLPEIPPLYMDMTVAEFLKFVAELKKVPKAERKAQIAEIMEMTGITDMQGRLIKNLSKGYRQRVGLAQAIIGYPEVIILDEPSVGLDPKQIIEIRELIKKLGENHTVILSSHILSEVSAVCDHIMIISHGKLVASDSPDGLQKLLSSNAKLNLLVKGNADEVAAALTTIENAEQVDVAVTDMEGCVSAVVEIAKGCDIREAVFYKLAELRLPILSMQLDEKSLEDIFLELTGEVQTEAEAEAETAEAEVAEAKIAEAEEAQAAEAAERAKIAEAEEVQAAEKAEKAKTAEAEKQREVGTKNLQATDATTVNTVQNDRAGKEEK